MLAALSAMALGELLQLSSDEELPHFLIVGDAQKIWLAADLAVFDVALLRSRGFIHGSLVPLAAPGALEACFHA